MTWQSMVFKVTRCYALPYNYRRRVDSTPYWPPSTGTLPITVPGLASRASGGAIAGSNCLFVPSHGPSPPVPSSSSSASKVLSLKSRGKVLKKA